MKWDFLKSKTRPRPPSRARAVATMGCLGALTGLISIVPSPLPDIRLEDEGLIINAEGTPIHAAIAFAILIGAVMWLWVTRDVVKCLLAMLVVVLAWLAAVNTGNDVFQALVGSDLFGTAPGAKVHRQILGLLVGGIAGGAVGAGLIAFAAGIPAERLRSPKNWILIVAVGAVLGVLLYPATSHSAPYILVVPWQAFVAAAIGFGLTRK